MLAKIGNWQLAMGFASSLHGPPAPGRDDAIDADLVEPDGNAATRSELAEIASDVNGNPHWDCSAWIGRMRLWAIPARTGREQRRIATRFGRTQPLTERLLASMRPTVDRWQQQVATRFERAQRLDDDGIEWQLASGMLSRWRMTAAIDNPHRAHSTFGP